LHDGGGDRAATVEALRRVLPVLKQKGFHFVTASALSHHTRGEVMPPLTAKELALVGMDRFVFGALFTTEWLLKLGFLLAIFLGIGRILFVSPLALFAH